MRDILEMVYFKLFSYTKDVVSEMTSFQNSYSDTNVSNTCWVYRQSNDKSQRKYY